MNVVILLDNGQTTSIPVKWHPGSLRALGNIAPAGLYTTKIRLAEHNKRIAERNLVRERHSESFRESEIRVSSIKCVEAPFEIFEDTQDKKPWEHDNTTITRIPYGEGIDWNFM